MLHLVQAFNRAQSDIRVSMQRIEWAIYYNKLLVAGLDGRAPDVFVCHTSALARLADGGFIGPVDELLAGPPHLDAADFDPNILAAARRAGTTWGVPLDVHPIGMYYNRALFNQVGLVDAAGAAAPPTNADEFLEALRRLRKGDGVSQARAWGFAVTWQRTNVYSLMRQWGGDIFGPDGATVVLDSPENAAALTYIADLIHREQLVARPQDGGGFIGFRQGRVGMVFEGIYMLTELQRQTDLDFGAAPLPQLGPHRAAWADSHLLCLAKGLKAKRRTAAAQFVKFLSDHSLEWAAAGQVPVRRSLRAAPAFAELAAQNAFAAQLPYVAYLPSVPYVLEYQTTFDAMLDRALRASAPPEVCLRDAAEEIRDAVARHQRRSRTA